MYMRFLSLRRNFLNLNFFTTYISQVFVCSLQSLTWIISLDIHLKQARVFSTLKLMREHNNCISSVVVFY